MILRCMLFVIDVQLLQNAIRVCDIIALVVVGQALPDKNIKM